MCVYFQNDGTILLHTRSARYGRLQNGIGLRVSPQLIKRQSKHIGHLQCGLQLILGVNGQLGFGVLGLGFRVWGFGFWVLGFRGYCARVEGLGFRVWTFEMQVIE